jgi:hypothetical protein
MDLIYRSTDNAKWGAGKNSPLTIAEEDGNKWAIQQAVENLTDNPPTAISIANFVIAGAQFQVVLTNGATLGPFPLPYASFKFRQEGYVIGGDYNELDLLPVPNKGLFMVQHSFHASGPFDPFAINDDGDRIYLQLFGTDVTIYDVNVSITGKPGDGIDDGDPIYQRIMVRNVCWLASESSISLAKVLAAADADIVISMHKNGDAIGTITIAASGTTATIALTTDTQFAPGDIFALMKPNDGVDATAKNLVATFALRNGVLADFGIT